MSRDEDLGKTLLKVVVGVLLVVIAGVALVVYLLTMSGGHV